MSICKHENSWGVHGIYPEVASETPDNHITIEVTMQNAYQLLRLSVTHKELSDMFTPLWLDCDREGWIDGTDVAKYTNSVSYWILTGRIGD